MYIINYVCIILYSMYITIMWLHNYDRHMYALYYIQCIIITIMWLHMTDKKMDGQFH